MHDSAPDVEDAKPRARRVGLPEKCPVPPNPTTNNQNRRLHAATWFPLQRGDVSLPPHSKANWKHQGSLEQLLAGLKEENSEGGIGKMVNVLVYCSGKLCRSPDSVTCKPSHLE